MLYMTFTYEPPPIKPTQIIIRNSTIRFSQNKKMVLNNQKVKFINYKIVKISTLLILTTDKELLERKTPIW